MLEEQLQHDPLVATRHRKPLGAVLPDFAHVPPLWELRVGDWRVFYDVDLEQSVVIVRAISHKRPGQTTNEVLDEDRNA